MNIRSVGTIFGGSLNKFEVLPCESRETQRIVSCDEGHDGAILPEVLAKEAGVGSLVPSRRAGWEFPSRVGRQTANSAAPPVCRQSLCLWQGKHWDAVEKSARTVEMPTFTVLLSRPVFVFRHFGGVIGVNSAWSLDYNGDRRG
jgi:hypothetical protein